MNPIKQAVSFYKLRSAWLGDGGRPVDREIAQKRARQCLACPKHDDSRPFIEALETAVAMEVRKQLEIKSEMQLRVDGEKSLHLCAGCGCVLRLKIHAPLKFIKETTDTENLDPKCWILNEAEG